MVIRNIWSSVDVPSSTTSKEQLTVPDDSMSINELFERAARGDSLGGGYDEFEEDSFFDMSHHPDFQDPLLREAVQLNKNEELNEERKKQSRRAKKSSSTTGEGDEQPKGDKTDSEGTPVDKEVES